MRSTSLPRPEFLARRSGTKVRVVVAAVRRSNATSSLPTEVRRSATSSRACWVRPTSAWSWRSLSRSNAHSRSSVFARCRSCSFSARRCLFSRSVDSMRSLSRSQPLRTSRTRLRRPWLSVSQRFAWSRSALDGVFIVPSPSNAAPAALAHSDPNQRPRGRVRLTNCRMWSSEPGPASRDSQITHARTNFFAGAQAAVLPRE